MENPDTLTLISDVDKQTLNSRLIFAFFSCVIGSSFLFGYHTGVVNLPQKIIQSFLNDTEKRRTGHEMSEEKSTILWAIIVSVFAIGGMIGGLSGGFFTKKLGSKKCMLANNLLTFIAVCLMSFSKLAHSYEMLIVGRCIAGIQSGISTAAAPAYLSEVAPIKLRGAAGTINQLAIVVGILISQAVGLKYCLGTNNYWPILLALPVKAAILQLILLPWCPESPKYLFIEKNDQDSTIKALQWLRGTDGFDDEISAMRVEKENNQFVTNIGILDILKTKWMRLPLLISVVMQLSQQLSGINAVIYYSTEIFRRAGLSLLTSQFATIGVSFINVLFTVISAFIMDLAGRRTLHLIGLGGMFCAACGLGASVLWEMQWSILSYFAIVSAIIYVCFFAIGPGPIPWFIVAEIFSQNTRSSAISVSVLVNWLANTLVGLGYPLLQHSIKAYSFIPFIILLAIFWVVLYYILPETKNKPIDEILSTFRDKQPIESYTNLDNEKIRNF